MGTSDDFPKLPEDAVHKRRELARKEKARAGELGLRAQLIQRIDDSFAMPNFIEGGIFENTRMSGTESVDVEELVDMVLELVTATLLGEK